MIYIYISVVCSVLVSASLKLAARFSIDIRQAICGNYLVSALLCLALLNPKPDLLFNVHLDMGWFILISLGVLLPSIFLVMAVSINKVGIVRTDAAQRLSLVLPLVAAFTFFGEAFTFQKSIGAIIALVAIGCIVARREARGEKNIKKNNWYWPLAVFVGLGAIDILFKLMAKLTKVPFEDVLFCTFALAFLLSTFYIVWLFVQTRANFKWRNVGGAVILGLLNFGNILFYIKAHKHLPQDPALVFSTMNIGVIVLASFIGLLAFKEKLSWLNSGGIVLAIVAVIILAAA